MKTTSPRAPAATSDRLRVLSAVDGAFIADVALDYGAQPAGIAFAGDGSALYVALLGRGRLLRIDPATRAIVGSLALGAVGAPGPKGISVSGDGSRVLVSRFISPDAGAQVWDVAAAGLTLTRTIGLTVDPGPDSSSSGRGLPNYLGAPAISPDGRHAWLACEKANIQRGGFRDGQALTHDNTVRALLAQIDLVANAEAARQDIDNRALPTAIAFSPRGDLAYVAFALNDEVAVFDTATGNRIGVIPVAGAPDGLVLSSDGTRLYAHRFLGPAVSSFDVTALAAGTGSTATPITASATVASSALGAQVLAGKRIFYNASDMRMSAEGYISCASCHLAGGHDGRTWDFTDRGEGLRNTIDLRGGAGVGHGAVHWSGNFDEVQDFEHDIRSAFAGSGFMANADFTTGNRNQPLGGAKAGLSPELDALAAYVSSLTNVGRSPLRTATGALTPAAEAGKQLFGDMACSTCHSGTRFTNSALPPQLRNVGTVTAASGKRLGATLTGIDTPTLRGLWDGAPYLHHGGAATLDVLVQTASPTHGPMATLNATERAQLVAYLRSIDDAEVSAPAPPPSGSN